MAYDVAKNVQRSFDALQMSRILHLLTSMHYNSLTFILKQEKATFSFVTLCDQSCE